MTALKTRRTAGSWVRRRFLRTTATMLVLLGAALGLLLGGFLALAVDGARLTMWIACPVAAAAVGAAYAFGRTRLAGRLEKGFRAEAAVGHAIECGLTAEHCAIAHAVTGVSGTAGDIDHLAATPGRLWVVETKYGWVPKRQFRRTIARLADNVEAVRRWAPAGTAVQGCLVLATGNMPGRRLYEEGAVVVRTRQELMRELKEEARLPPAPGARLAAERVWKLAGQGAEEGDRALTPPVPAGSPAAD